MIMIPVTDQADRELIMVFITPEAIAKLQGGQSVTLLSSKLRSIVGVDGVLLRFATDHAAAAAIAIAQKIAGHDAELAFHLTEVDAPRRPT